MELPHPPNFSSAPWVPGEPLPVEGEHYPLERYFPPVPRGMVPDWVSHFAAAGSWILDPFGQNPFTSLELARAGYRILISANNPIAAFVLRVLAGAPDYQDFSEALAALAKSKMRDGSTVEDYIQAFYRLDCPSESCRGLETPGKFEVETFIWEESSDQERIAATAIGECPLCGLKGEIELTPALLETLAKPPSYALIRSQVLERIASQDPALRRVMEEVISFYSPRALIGLHLLLSKIESSSLSPEQARLLRALWLTAADQCNQLWIWPRAQNRPKQLLRPPVYQEANVWKAFVNGVSLWVHGQEEVKLRAWPKRVPPTGGISLFEGRLRELEQKPETDLISLVQCSLPRRNQAFWNLSGFWSGWLWGKDGVKTVRNSLLRQRYDWTWHSVALRKVLSQLPALIGSDMPVLLLTSELESLFLLAGMLGAQSAGLRLSKAALNGETSMLQTVWRLPTPMIASHSHPNGSTAIKEAGKSFLRQFGEPAHWQRLISSTLTELMSADALKDRPRAGETLNEIEAEFSAAFNDVSHFQRFNPGTAPEAGLYWLADDEMILTSMADRAEETILRALQSRSSLTRKEIFSAVYAELAGFHTPPEELVQEILESYAVLAEEGENSFYKIKPNETATERDLDLNEMHALLEEMAERLEFRRETLPDRVVWFDKTGEALYSFFPIATTCVSNLLRANRHLGGLKFIVLPGSRSNLASYKLKRDPNLRLLLGEDWQLVKYRQLRNLAGNPLLNRELFRSQICSDPPEFHTSQLALF